MHPGIPDDFRGNLNPGIKKYFPGIPGTFNFLKYKFFDVINEVFGYNLYKSTKKMIDFIIIPGIPRIPEDLEKLIACFSFWNGIGNSTP